MASRTLYPPIVDPYMPAFKAGNTSCRVYFSLSKFNGSSDFSSVHISVVKQNTGMNVVKTTDDKASNKYRSTGIIINAKATKVMDEDNLYYIEIEDNDLSSISGSYSGWIPGWIYKIQLRLSSKDYDGSIGQAAWLNNNASNFSEWSTVCTVKATGRIDYDIPILGIDTRNENNDVLSGEQIVYSSTLQLYGSFYRNADLSELIHSYSFVLYDKDDHIIEESGEIYANQYQNNDSFNYLMKTELIDGERYKLGFKFTTINHFIGGFYQYDEDRDDRFEFVCSIYQIELPGCRLLTAENDIEDSLKDITNIFEEEEEGRVGIKFYDDRGKEWSGNLCVRRASSKDNFSTWTDIYLYTARQEDLNEIPMFYDYTAESGVWYKYCVQTISTIGDRSLSWITPNPVLRNYNYSFLLGKNNQQLKLMFDNNMNNFKYQIADSRIDPIGSKYTTISRNATTYYRTFPINGLISFWMDENKLFCDKKVIYNYDNVIDLYNQYNEDHNILQYDYIYERDFRDKVLEFLQDGELKLFKSPTEGNIIVRLTDVNCVPNQSLDRMIYSFSSNAYEMDAPTMENYLKYGFYSVDKYATEFATYETRLGQLSINFRVGDNVFQKIFEKYDSNGRNTAGYTKTVMNIHHIKITFDDIPLRVENSGGEIVIGNNFYLNNKLFTVYNSSVYTYDAIDPETGEFVQRERYGVRMYEFDNRLIYTPKDTLILLGDAEKKVKTVHATVDFLYDFKTDLYVKKQVQSRMSTQGVGQIFQECIPGENLYKELYYKYFTEWPYDFRRLYMLSAIEIEAIPGAAFRIRDAEDITGEVHIIGATGQLRLYDIENITEIVYLGMMNQKTGIIETTKQVIRNKEEVTIPYYADVLINYFYLMTKGTYKKET